MEDLQEYCIQKVPADKNTDGNRRHLTLKNHFFCYLQRKIGNGINSVSQKERGSLKEIWSESVTEAKGTSKEVTGETEDNGV